ncbi:MAG: GGDEF domain-containing protein [Lachnospiraceae bacterium]|nr:GGDEF domain-containing protein [Lachnospiraceae bacterium]
MNLQAIFVANLTGFFLIFFLFFSRFITKTKSDTEEHSFEVMMTLAMIACIVEPLTFAVDGIPGKLPYWINLLGNTYLYYANGLGSFLWLLYLDLKLYHDRSRMKKIYYKISVPVGILLLSLIGNIWGNYYFYVDEHNIYHRQPNIYIFYIYLMLCAVYSLVLYYRHRKTHGQIAFFPIYMYLTPIIVSSVLQMLFYGISLAWLGTALGIVALYMSLQQQNTYLDTLTGMYNRLYLEHALFRMRRDFSTHYYGAMIDMNDFKEINDTYGHSAGDQALRDMADLFRKVTSDNTTVFRFAGDEFILLIKTFSEEDICELKYRLESAVADFNSQKIHPYKLSFSMGYAEFDRENDTNDSFFKKIDYAMYAQKKDYHSN